MFRATDPRDKVYALLGLLPAYFREWVKPDYTLSIDQTLLDIAKAFFLGDQNLRVLAHTKTLKRRQWTAIVGPGYLSDSNR